MLPVHGVPWVGLVLLTQDHLTLVLGNRSTAGELTFDAAPGSPAVRRETRTRRQGGETAGTRPGRGDDRAAEIGPVPTCQGEPLTSGGIWVTTATQIPPLRLHHFGTTFSVMLPTIELSFRSAIVMVWRPSGCSV